MPAILESRLYIDVFGQGLETGIRQIIDVINGNNTYTPQKGFHNIRAHVSIVANILTVEFRAAIYMEPHSRYLILLDNVKDDLIFSVVGESIFESGFLENITLNNGMKVNAVLVARSSATSPGFPLIAEIKSTNTNTNNKGFNKGLLIRV